MGDAVRCATCGGTIPGDAPRGLCPACLLGLAAASAADAGDGTLELARGSAGGSVPGAGDPAGNDKRYVVLGERGRGGMGRVLAVHDAHLDRDIALKELLPAAGDRSTPAPARHAKDLVARFMNEARITGRLEHPSITPVHELGLREDGTPYYTMKLIKGRTLARAIEEAGTLERRLTLLPHFVDLCQAVAYAHGRGVVHRDLKPQNVIVGDFGETVIVDWGLAKAKGQADARAEEMGDTLREIRDGREADAGSTAYGAALGTPAYMPPEQALGRLDEIDERSDVYALGAVLYHLLAGRAPFEGTTVAEVLRKAIAEAPPALRSFEPRVPAELAEACEAAMRREPARRVPSARRLGERVGSWSPRPFSLNPFRPELRELLPALAALPDEEQRRLVSRATRRALRNWRFPVTEVVRLTFVLFFALLAGGVAPLWLIWTIDVTQRLAAQERYAATLEATVKVLGGRPAAALPVPMSDESPLVRAAPWLESRLRPLGLLLVGMSWLLFYVYLRFHAEWRRQALLPHVREELAERPGT